MKSNGFMPHDWWGEFRGVAGLVLPLEPQFIPLILMKDVSLGDVLAPLLVLLQAAVVW